MNWDSIFWAAWAAALLVCYRQGLREGLGLRRRWRLRRYRRHGRRPANPAPAAQPFDSRYDALLANIDAYDGTDAGQRPV